MHCFRKILPRASGLLILLLSAWFIAPASRARPDAAARKVKRSVATNLVFDEVFKSYDAKPGDAQAPFIFMVTNTWTNVITVDRIETSCGCTLARMPSNPWHVAAGEHGAIDVKVNL